MLFIIAIVFLTTCKLSLSQAERRQTEHWNGLLLTPQTEVNYVGDTEDSLHPSCHGLWTIAKEDSGNTSCECGSNLKGLVQCDDSSFKLQLVPCYCMTPYEKDPNITVVGACLYQCYYHHHHHYYSIPAENQTSLSQFMCSRVTNLNMNREGTLCGHCKQGFALPVYSYMWQCTNCSLSDKHVKHLAKYIAIAFLPLTVFFVIVTSLHISATSPSINSFILISQLTTAPIVMRTYVLITRLVVYKNFLYFIAALYGIWNLDFFRTFYTPFCLHPSMNTLQVFALEYTIAAYPLFLILITYALVELHDRNFKFVVWLWKPFRRCFIHFRRNWNIKTSLIDAFGTFLLLSYVKFLSASFDILTPVHLYNVHGETINETYLYYDATIPYFSKQHLPYAILAITVLILFNFLPIVLLCLYPCQCFQKLLNCCQLRCTALHTFMDTFQGCYRNRTDHTYDCRWFSAVYLIVRIGFHLLAAITQDTQLLFLFSAVLLIVTVITIGVVQPYKTPIHNRLDIVLILILAVSYLSSSLVIKARAEYYQLIVFTEAIGLICVLLPLVFIITISIRWLLIRKMVPQRFYRNIGKLLPCRRLIRQRNSEEVLPDRLANPEECAALLRDPMAVDY